MLRIPKRASLGSLGKQTSKLIIILNAEHVLEWTWEDQDTVLKTHSFRRLGGSVVERLPSAQVVIPGSWDRVSHQAPCSVGSVLLPLPLPLPLLVCSVSVK